ncbi:ketosynthase [Lysobacter korlensis]|uniref:Ketosynthase n=1 Tax=Lysobacter korlensis TaxID=553636 RepID=A0ABV6RKT5_9GAMM
MSGTAAAQVLLAVAYPFLAHWASERGGGLPAALTLADLALLVLIGPLARGSVWAWVLTAGLGAMLALNVESRWLPVLLLAPPVVFTGLVAWCFARSLAPPRTPLITKIAAAIEYDDPAQMPPAQQRYTRALTAAWAWLLAGLALANLLLALIAVPDGVLARLGHVPPIAISQTTWSWFANLLNYGVVGGFFVGEYLLRHRLFPQRNYRNFGEFLRRMAGLGPQFWQRLFD